MVFLTFLILLQFQFVEASDVTRYQPTRLEWVQIYSMANCKPSEAFLKVEVVEPNQLVVIIHPLANVKGDQRTKLQSHFFQSFQSCITSYLKEKSWLDIVVKQSKL